MVPRHRAVPDPRSESGQIVIITALMLPILLACAGLAVDIGYAYDYRRRLQAAADSAVLAAGFEIKNSNAVTQSVLESVARGDATGNGFTHGTSGVVVTVTRQPAAMSGCNEYDYTTDIYAVRVRITQPRATFLARLIGRTSFDIGACAISSLAADNGTGFVILNNLTASGGSNVAISGRTVVNNTLTVGGGGTYASSGGVFAKTAVASGGSTISPAASTLTTPVTDPLSYLPTPVPSGTNRGSVTYSDAGSVTLNPGIYTGISISGSTTATFNPGTYYVGSGKIEIKGGARVSGTGVMLYAYNNSFLTIANNTTVVSLSAPTTGIYAGILYFQDRANTKDSVVSGGATVNLTGTIYQINPSSKFTFSGGSSSGSTTEYSIFVVYDFVIGGGGLFAPNDFSSLPAGSPIKKISLAE